MEVVSRRERLHASKPRMLEPPCQHNVTVDPAPFRRHLRERHPDLKRDPRLLRQHAHRPERAHPRHNLVVERADRSRLALEMIREAVPATGMLLVAVGERTSACAAAPEGPRGHDGLSTPTSEAPGPIIMATSIICGTERLGSSSSSKAGRGTEGA